MAPEELNRTAATPFQAAVIRIALLAGVVLFGVVILLLRSKQPPPCAPAAQQPLVYVFAVLAVADVSLAVVMKRRQEATDEWAQRLTCSITSWATCEATALLGGVYWLLTGEPALYTIGALLLLGSLLLVVPRPSDTAV